MRVSPHTATRVRQSRQRLATTQRRNPAPFCPFACSRVRIDNIWPRAARLPRRTQSAVWGIFVTWRKQSYDVLDRLGSVRRVVVQGRDRLQPAVWRMCGKGKLLRGCLL